MFLPARMRKLKIITLDRYADSIIRSLHEERITQIEDISERIQLDAEWAQILKPSKSTPHTGKIASLLMRTTGIIDFMDSMASEEKSLKDVIKEFINPPLFEKREVEETDSQSLIKKVEETLSNVESKTKVMEEDLNRLDTEKGELEAAVDISEKLIDFDVNLADIQDSKYITAIVGKISTENFKTLEEKIRELTDEFIIFDSETEIKTERIIFLITLKKHQEAIAGILRRLEFERFEIAGLRGKPAEIIQKSKKRLEGIYNKRKAIIKDLTKIKDQWEEELLVLKEELEIEKERNEIFSAFGETEKTIMFEAWVPLKNCDKAKKIIKNASKNHCFIEIEKPEDEEEVPVLLENPHFAKPYENFVKMYSPLKYNEVDPTIFMALIFPFFFGFCLTDAFYGIVDASIGFILYRGLGKVNRFMRDFGIILMACGVWAFILGMLTNGFIGDFFPRFFNINLPTVIPIIDAFKHPQNLLLMALTAGVLHINFGLLVGARNNIRMGNINEALGSQIVWFILELGIILLAIGWMLNLLPLTATGGIILLLGFVMLIYYNGLFGLMDVSGFLGTLLSYARLLALCLSTGGIAMTVNILTQLCTDLIPMIGIAVAPVIFVFGHIVNDAFQSLGAFINSLRLHYVEFFSQFYMGGKRRFNPFGAKRKFTKIRR